jgi:hypothetical protein
MGEFETEYKIAELINKAIKFRDEHDLINFNLIIEEIDKLSYHRKFDLMEFLFDVEFRIDIDYELENITGEELINLKDFKDKYDDLDSNWTDTFILNDIELRYETLECLNLLETLIMIGKRYDESFYQNLVTSILQKIDIESDEIYYVREYLINSYIFSDYIPDCFKLKENEVLPKLEPLTEGTPFFSFIFNKEGLVEFDIHPYYYEICDLDYNLGEDYEKGRIEDNLRLIPQDDSLKLDFLNYKIFF